MTRRGYVCIIAALLTIAGCKAKINPYQGFNIGTSERLQSAQTGLPGPELPMVEVNVLGQYSPHSGDEPDGSVTRYNGYTSKSKNPDDTQGLYYVSDAMTSVFWNHKVWMEDNCVGGGLPIYLVDPGYGTDDEEWGQDNVWMANTGLNAPAEFAWVCTVPPGQLPELSTQFAFTGEIPSSVTMAGWNPYTAANGMPEMYIFSGAGGSPSFYTEIDASSVDPSGATATFNLPSNMPQNAYAFEVMNQNADGTVHHQGFNFFAAASSQTIAGNPFGVAAQAITTSWQSAYNPDPYGDETCQGQWTYDSGSSTSTSPVVTLYSLNQVNNGGAAIAVGPNPTAIAAYNYEDT